jgi:hypothetical protein
VERIGDKGNASRISVANPEGMRPLERPRRRWEENIKMNLKMVWGGMYWIYLVPDRDQWKALVNTIISLWVP